jgi:uncharacterized protein with HEPN domain
MPFLLDMPESVVKRERYIDSLDKAAFVANDLVLDAVIRNLEIIGEAARQIPEALREQYPLVPWRRVVGLRNVVIHRHLAADPDIIWAIATQQLPELKTLLQTMLYDLNKPVKDASL